MSKKYGRTLPEQSAQYSVDRCSEDVTVSYTKMKSEVKKRAGTDVIEINKTGGGQRFGKRTP